MLVKSSHSSSSSYYDTVKLTTIIPLFFVLPVNHFKDPFLGPLNLILVLDCSESTLLLLHLHSSHAAITLLLLILWVYCMWPIIQGRDDAGWLSAMISMGMSSLLGPQH